MARIKTTIQQGSIGPPRGMEQVTGFDSATSDYTSEDAGEFFVQVRNDGDISIETVQGDLITFTGLSSGDVLQAAGLPLLCRRVRTQSSSSTTVNAFDAVFLG